MPCCLGCTVDAVLLSGNGCAPLSRASGGVRRNRSTEGDDAKDTTEALPARQSSIAPRQGSVQNKVGSRCVFCLRTVSASCLLVLPPPEARRRRRRTHQFTPRQCRGDEAAPAPPNGGPGGILHPAPPLGAPFTELCTPPAQRSKARTHECCTAAVTNRGRRNSSSACPATPAPHRCTLIAIRNGSRQIGHSGKPPDAPPGPPPVPPPARRRASSSSSCRRLLQRDHAAGAEAAVPCAVARRPTRTGQKRGQCQTNAGTKKQLDHRCAFFLLPPGSATAAAQTYSMMSPAAEGRAGRTGCETEEEQRAAPHGTGA